jgi:hypothetical protein
VTAMLLPPQTRAKGKGVKEVEEREDSDPTNMEMGKRGDSHGFRGSVIMRNIDAKTRDRILKTNKR